MSKFLSKSVLSFIIATIFCCTNVVYADGKESDGCIRTLPAGEFSSEQPSGLQPFAGTFQSDQPIGGQVSEESLSNLSSEEGASCDGALSNKEKLQMDPSQKEKVLTSEALLDQSMKVQVTDEKLQTSGQAAVLTKEQCLSNADGNSFVGAGVNAGTREATIFSTSVISSSSKKVQDKFAELIRNLVKQHMCMKYGIDILKGFKYDEENHSFILQVSDPIESDIDEVSKRIYELYLSSDSGKKINEYGEIYSVLDGYIKDCIDKDDESKIEKLKYVPMIGVNEYSFLCIPNVKRRFCNIIEQVLSGCPFFDFSDRDKQDIIWSIYCSSDVKSTLYDQVGKALNACGNDQCKIEQLLEELTIKSNLIDDETSTGPKQQFEHLSHKEDSLALTTVGQRDDRNHMPLGVCLLNVIVLGKDNGLNKRIVSKICMLGESIYSFKGVDLGSKRSMELGLSEDCVVAQKKGLRFAINCMMAETLDSDERIRSCHYVLCPFEIKSVENIEAKVNQLWKDIRDKNEYCEILFVPVKNSKFGDGEFAKYCVLAKQNVDVLKKKDKARQAVGLMCISEDDLKLGEFLKIIDTWGLERIKDVEKILGCKEVRLDLEDLSKSSSALCGRKTIAISENFESVTVVSGKSCDKRTSAIEETEGGDEDARDDVVTSAEASEDERSSDKIVQDRIQGSNGNASTDVAEMQKKVDEAANVAVDSLLIIKDKFNVATDDGLKNGILVFDKNGVLLFSREAFKFLFKDDGVKDAFIGVIRRLLACQRDWKHILNIKFTPARWKLFQKNKFELCNIDNFNLIFNVNHLEFYRDVDLSQYIKLYDEMILANPEKDDCKGLRYACAACWCALDGNKFEKMRNALSGFKSVVHNVWGVGEQYITFTFGELIEGECKRECENLIPLEDEDKQDRCGLPLRYYKLFNDVAVKEHLKDIIRNKNSYWCFEMCYSKNKFFCYLLEKNLKGAYESVLFKPLNKSCQEACAKCWLKGCSYNEIREKLLEASIDYSETYVIS